MKLLFALLIKMTLRFGTVLLKQQKHYRPRELLELTRHLPAKSRSRESILCRLKCCVVLRAVLLAALWMGAVAQESFARMEQRHFPSLSEVQYFCSCARVE